MVIYGYLKLPFFLPICIIIIFKELTVTLMLGSRLERTFSKQLRKSKRHTLMMSHGCGWLKDVGPRTHSAWGKRIPHCNPWQLELPTLCSAYRAGPQYTTYSIIPIAWQAAFFPLLFWVHSGGILGENARFCPHTLTTKSITDLCAKLDPADALLGLVSGDKRICLSPCVPLLMVRENFHTAPRDRLAEPLTLN